MRVALHRIRRTSGQTSAPVGKGSPNSGDTGIQNSHVAAQAAVLGGLFGRHRTARNPFSRRKRVSSCVHQRPIDRHEDSRYPSLANSATRAASEWLRIYEALHSCSIPCACGLGSYPPYGGQTSAPMRNGGPNSGERGIVNPHVAARAAVLGGVLSRVRRGEDGALSNRAFRNPFSQRKRVSPGRA